MKMATLEALFILGFGIFHFALPFIFPANSNAAHFFGLQIAYFVLPGCFLLASLSIIFWATKNRYLAGLLALLFGGGLTFHVLYISNLFPSIILVPNKFVSVAGILIDALAIIAIYDYYRRFHGAPV